MDIILDGEMDGIATAIEIRKNYDIPIIFVTAHSEKSFIQKAKAIETYGYIVKPVSERELYTSIETTLYRHKIDMKLKESEEKYRSLFEKSRDAIYLCDETGKIVDINQSMIKLLGYNTKELINLKLRDLTIKPRDLKKILQILDEKNFTQDYETKMQKKDGEEIDCLITATKLFDTNGKVTGFQGIVRDITEWKRSESEKEVLLSELRDLSTHLQSIREEERTSIAREIHDELGQSLTAFKMDISWIMNKLNQGQEEIHEKLNLMSNLVDNTIQTVRKISSELRPGILDDLGLIAAIEWQAGEIEKRTNIKHKIICDPEEIEISDEKKITIFRLFQEAMTNVVRHSKSSEVKINLKKNGKNITLEIIDNGIGITEEQINDSKSLGIIGMRERVVFCNGDVTFKGKINKGTKVKVSIPLEINGR